jgi:hypothetical protein
MGAVVHVSDYSSFTDLPINFPFDFEYVKEHLDPSQFCGQREWRQILHVPNVELRPDLVGHVERRLPETHVHTYNIIII